MFGWKEGSHIKLKAEEAGQHLQGLRAQYGFLTAELVLQDAYDPASPLHSHFQWDDTEAAQQYRLAQAGHILRCIVILRGEEHKEPLRAFVVIRDADGSAYQDLQIVMNDALLREQVLSRALREAELWQSRYNDLVELATVFEAIAATKEKVAPRRRRTRQLVTAG